MGIGAQVTTSQIFLTPPCPDHMQKIYYWKERSNLVQGIDLKEAEQTFMRVRRIGFFTRPLNEQ